MHVLGYGVITQTGRMVLYYPVTTSLQQHLLPTEHPQSATVKVTGLCEVRNYMVQPLTAEVPTFCLACINWVATGYQFTGNVGSTYRWGN